MIDMLYNLNKSTINSCSYSFTKLISIIIFFMHLSILFKTFYLFYNIYLTFFLFIYFYIINQDIRIYIYVAYSRHNGWTDWAKKNLGRLKSYRGCHRFFFKNSILKKVPRATQGILARLLYIIYIYINLSSTSMLNEVVERLMSEVDPFPDYPEDIPRYSFIY